MRTRALLIAAILWFASDRASAAPSFTAIRFEPATSSAYLVTTDVSADGRVVAGTVSAPVGRRAFRWTAATGVEILESPAGSNVQTVGIGVSADGQTIVGQVELQQSAPGAYWSSSGSIEYLDGLSTTNLPWAVSADGSTIVGRSANRHAFAWTATDGFRDLGDLPGGIDDSSAFGISDDGRTIVGESGSDASRFGEAFVWTESTGMIGIGGTRARAVSSDGSIVVGDLNLDAFVWTAATGLQALTPAGSNLRFRTARDVSGDGSIIVGSGIADGTTKALVWTPDRGIVRLDSLLTTLGLDVSGWDLTSAMAISRDGSTIVGFGTPEVGHTTIFVAVIPEPSSTLLVGLGLAAMAIMRPRSG